MERLYGSWRPTLVLQQPAVFAVGSPTVELLSRYGKHTDAAGKGDAAFDEMPQDVFVAAGQRPQGDGDGNAVPDCPEPDERG